MPYTTKKNCVYKVGDTKPLKCYDNHADALKYLAALEANVDKELSAEQKQILKQATVFTQQQVEYVPLSSKGNQACANCVFYRSTAYDGIDYPHCLIVENDDPNPIEATGWCNHWEAKPEPPADLVDVIEEAIEGVGQVVTEAVAAAMPMATLEMEHKPKPNLIQRAKQALFPEKEMGAFNVFKGSDGKWYWIAKYTNAYEDKEHEIFTEKAHEDYIRRLDMGLVDQPELWVWHTKGTKHGKADTVFGVGRIMVALGHFDESPEAKKAIQFYQKHADKLKLSHGALAPKWAIHDGLIESYNTFEISVLPDGAESNPYTSYEVIKSMQPDPKKLQMVEAVLGKEKADKLVSDTAEYSKEVENMMVRYKDNSETGATPTEPTSEAQKNMGEVFVEMVKEQGDIAKLLISIDKKITAKDAETTELIKALTKEVADAKAGEAELRKLMNAPLRRPSGDDSTEVNKETLDKVQKQAPNSDSKRDEMRGFLGLPSSQGSN